MSSYKQSYCDIDECEAITFETDKQIKYQKVNKYFLVQYIEYANLRNLVMSFHRLKK